MDQMDMFTKYSNDYDCVTDTWYYVADITWFCKAGPLPVLPTNRTNYGGSAMRYGNFKAAKLKWDVKFHAAMLLWTALCK